MHQNILGRPGFENMNVCSIHNKNTRFKSFIYHPLFCYLVGLHSNNTKYFNLRSGLSDITFPRQPRPLILQKNGCQNLFLVLSDDWMSANSYHCYFNIIVLFTFRSPTLKSKTYGKGWSSYHSDDLFGFDGGRTEVDTPSMFKVFSIQCNPTLQSSL